MCVWSGSGPQSLTENAPLLSHPKHTSLGSTKTPRDADARCKAHLNLTDSEGCFRPRQLSSKRETSKAQIISNTLSSTRRFSRGMPQVLNPARPPDFLKHAVDQQGLTVWLPGFLFRIFSFDYKPPAVRRGDACMSLTARAPWLAFRTSKGIDISSPQTYIDHIL